MAEYDDIINLPHPVSKNHPRMSLWNRAAQFAPFAALTGYGAAIDETARQTDVQKDLGEYELDELNRKMALLLEEITDNPAVTIVYFEPDRRKSGGAYRTLTCRLKSLDEAKHVLLTTDGQKIPLAGIVEIT
ncbi:MAG: hypothetical protein II899_03545 [Bacteroidales bacterium]|nr:hypothetical protein [Bacteroidales bacterium]